VGGVVGISLTTKATRLQQLIPYFIYFFKKNVVGGVGG
jgi:hypothetical protein